MQSNDGVVKLALTFNMFLRQKEDTPCDSKRVLLKKNSLFFLLWLDKFMNSSEKSLWF